MEDQQPAIFSFNFDETAQAHFVSIAKWNRFMAIVGIMVCCIVILLLVFGGSFIFSNLLRYQAASTYPNSYSSSLAGGGFAALIAVYVFFTGIYLVPAFSG